MHSSREGGERKWEAATPFLRCHETGGRLATLNYAVHQDAYVRPFEKRSYAFYEAINVD